MTTGDFWNLDNPAKPWGEFDPSDVINIPYDWAEWLSGQGTSYSSHEMKLPAEFESLDVGVSNGVVLVQVKVKAGEAVTINKKYPITCHIVALDGQERDKSVYLKIVER